MSNYIVTVIKTGNSYALRVPKAYVQAAELQLGERVHLQLPQKMSIPDPARIQRLIAEIQAAKPYRGIADPVTWQREQRVDRPMLGRE